MRGTILKDSRKACTSDELASDLPVVHMRRGAVHNQTVQDNLREEARQLPCPVACLALEAAP